MNAADRSRTEASASAPASRLGIYFVDPLAVPDGLGAALAEAAVMGFTAAMVPPPTAPAGDGDRYRPSDLQALHPALGQGTVQDWLTRFCTECRRAGLEPMVDVPVGGSPASAVAIASDPRSHVVMRAPSPEAWAAVLPSWHAAGLAGIRVLGLDECPTALGSIRDAAPGLVLIAWTPGMQPDGVAGLRGVADYVVASLPWWDGKASWFEAELARLREVAPVLNCPEIPFGPRFAGTVHDPAFIDSACKRQTGLACLFGDGWLVPAGFEHGARRDMDPRLGSADPRRNPALVTEIARLNALPAWPRPGVARLTGGGPVIAMLRTDAADARFSRAATLLLLNTDMTRTRAVDPSGLLSGIDGRFGDFSGPAELRPGGALVLQPGVLSVFSATATHAAAPSGTLDASAARRYAEGPRVAIEAPSPIVEDGSLPVKRLSGEAVAVEADILCDGHDKLSAVLRWRGPGGAAWQEVRMQPLGNDRFGATLPLGPIGAYEYTIQAWRDAWATYRDEIAKKSTAGLEIGLELREGLALLGRSVAGVQDPLRAELATILSAATAGDDAVRLQHFLSAELAALMQQADDRPRAAILPRPVRIDAERPGAAFAAWYEIFPRSMSDDPARHGTFKDVERHLPRIRAMGFDVLYFPPISPIGRTNRKGPNNTLTPAEGDPGSPYAIGSSEGGHDAIHPELGSVADFRDLVAAAAGHGLEIAIDFAIQCSPDHPWLKQHRGWFDWRPDGSIKYAENPPKKYQDIVNVDFYQPEAIPDLWVAIADAVMWWMQQGVRLVRVDNPHTKPLPFWEWMIAAVRAQYPDAVFLAEAFTRPKLMYRLAKVGFSQSYTYFTWRETKREMEQYLTELSAPGPRDFFRPHFFVNTPDINPIYLQGASRSAYLVRAALAATLSGLWGVYCGFELCEGTPVPGREEYLDSEKYQIRAWDWDRPGNIVPEITALNRLRRENPALRTHLDTAFLPAGNDVVSVFLKATPDRSNALVTAISFDPDNAQATDWEFPFWLWGGTEATVFEAEDLLSGTTETWQGKYRRSVLLPGRPYIVWRVRALS